MERNEKFENVIRNIKSECEESIIAEGSLYWYCSVEIRNNPEFLHSLVNCDNDEEYEEKRDALNKEFLEYLEPYKGSKDNLCYLHYNIDKEGYEVDLSASDKKETDRQHTKILIVDDADDSNCLIGNGHDYCDAGEGEEFDYMMTASAKEYDFAEGEPAEDEDGNEIEYNINWIFTGRKYSEDEEFADVNWDKYDTENQDYDYSNAEVTVI